MPSSPCATCSGCGAAPTRSMAPSSACSRLRCSKKLDLHAEQRRLEMQCLRSGSQADQHAMLILDCGRETRAGQCRVHLDFGVSAVEVREARKVADHAPRFQRDIHVDHAQAVHAKWIGMVAIVKG